MLDSLARFLLHLPVGLLKSLQVIKMLLCVKYACCVDGVNIL